MSDFLSQFEKDKYKRSEFSKDSSKLVTEEIQVENSSNKKEEVNKEKEEPVKKEEKAVRTIKIDYEEEKETGNKNRAIETVDHDTEIDTKYNKRKIILYVSIAVTIIVVALIVFFSVRLANQVTVKNFVGTNINDAKTWGLKNKIEIEEESLYNMEQNSDIIFYQDKEAGEKISKGSVLKLQVSKGADPDEKIELPDFSQMNLVQIQDWIAKNKTTNISVITEFNKEAPKNKFIRKEFKKDIVNESNFTRKDGINIYVSKGEEVFEKNISVPSFKNKAKSEVDTWAETNDVQIEYTENGSNTVLEGLVISQDIEEGSKVAKKDVINIVISKGKGVIVPNFNNILMDEAASAVEGLMVSVSTKYSSSVAYGKLISQSVKSGVALYSDSKSVQVIYSEGKPYMEDLKGRTEKDLAPYFYNFTSKGANITYEVKYVDSSEKKGTIVWQSKTEEFIKMEDKIVIHVSKGNLKPDSNIDNDVNTVKK